MKLTQVPNLRVEDFPSEQEWIGRLFIQLNPFIQSLNQIFLNNIEFSNNIKSVTREYSISSFQEFSFQWPYKDAAPVDVRVVKGFKGSTLTPTILLAAWDYSASTSQITISRMVEVNSTSVSELSGQYKFSIRATV